MSRIDGFFNSSPIHKVVNSGISRPASAEPSQRTPVTDRLELSGAQQYLSILKKQSGVRGELVASIREQIDNGTYLSDDKLNIAMDRLLDDLGV